MSSVEIALKFSGILLLGLAAVQDMRERKVSNRITLPLLAAALLSCSLHGDVGEKAFSLVLALLLFGIWHLGWMGGADAKALMALALAWMPAFFVATLFIAVFGIAYRLRGEKKYPGFLPISLAATLTFIGELSIMALN